MTKSATAATRLRMTSQHRGESRKSISSRSMSLKGEKSWVVVLQVEGLYYAIKGGPQQIRGRRRRDHNFRNYRVRSIREGHTT
jgi:hypothetical protein